MKKHIVHNFSFYINKKYIKNLWDEKNTKYQTNISLLRNMRESPFLFLKMEENWLEITVEKTNLCLTFYFLFSKTKKKYAKVKMNTIR